VFGSAESEHPRLTKNGEIISEEFQPIYDRNPPPLQTDGRTDRQTHRRHAIARPRFALVHLAVKSTSFGKRMPNEMTMSGNVQAMDEWSQWTEQMRARQDVC